MGKASVQGGSAENQGIPYGVGGYLGKKSGRRKACGLVYYVEYGLLVEIHNIYIHTCVKLNIFVSNGNAIAYGRIMNVLAWFESYDDVADAFEFFRVNCLRTSSLEEVE